MHWWMWLESSMLSVGWLVMLGIQIACIIHVVKTGRPYWWIWIIFCFPLVGLAAYIILEVKPTWARLNLNALLWRLKSPRQRIGILEANLEDSSTIKNRLALADELSYAGRNDQECEVVAAGLAGPFKDDAQLLMRLAQAQLEAGRPAEAERIIEKVVPERSSDSQLQHALLRARILGHLGRGAEAETLFVGLVARKKSEAPRYYYAEFLLCAQRREEATAILRNILHQYRRGTTVWRFQENRWFYAARQLLKSPPPVSVQSAKTSVGSEANVA